MSIRRGLMVFCALVFEVPLLPAAVPTQAVAAPDFSKIEIKTNRLADNFYIIDESQAEGGSVSLLIGQDGIVMVDTGIAALAPQVAAAIKRLSTQPIRYVINTHVHVDETGGNDYFAALGATVIAREQVRRRMQHPRPLADGVPRKPMPQIAWPKLTYDNAMTLHFNGQDIQLIAVPNAHTDGDTLIYFPGSDIIVAGDVLRPGSYPSMNRPDGGTLPGMLNALATIIGRAGPQTRIFTSHGLVVDRMAVIAQRDFIVTARERITSLMAQGKSEQQIVALTAQIVDGYKVAAEQAHTLPERFVRDMYAELKLSQ